MTKMKHEQKQELFSNSAEQNALNPKYRSFYHHFIYQTRVEAAVVEYLTWKNYKKLIFRDLRKQQLHSLSIPLLLSVCTCSDLP